MPDALGTQRPGPLPPGPIGPTRLPWIGLLVIVAGALWLLVALVEPLAGAYVGPLPPRFPDILLVVIAGIVILAVAFVLKIGDLKGSWKKGIAAGVVLGLVLSGAMAGIAYLNGVPVLNPTCNPNYGSNWCKAANPIWSEDGRPVVFFYGSQACPYCSASSWAIVEALSAFGTLSGLTYGYSSPTDTAGPNTPETGLSSSALSSSFITWDPHEDPGNQSIALPGLDLPGAPVRQRLQPYLVHPVPGGRRDVRPSGHVRLPRHARAALLADGGLGHAIPDRGLLERQWRGDLHRGVHRQDAAERGARPSVGGQGR